MNWIDNLGKYLGSTIAKAIPKGDEKLDWNPDFDHCVDRLIKVCRSKIPFPEMTQAGSDLMRHDIRAVLEELHKRSTN